MHELNHWLLGEVKSAEMLAVDEASHAMDGLEPMLGLVGDVLASEKVDLERV